MAFPKELTEAEYNKAMAVFTEIIPPEKLKKFVKSTCLRKPIQNFTLIELCRIYRLADFERKNIAKLYCSFNTKYTLATVRNKLTKFKDFLNQFNAEDIRKRIKKSIESKSEIEKEAQKVAIQVQKTKDLMSVFNLKHKEVEARIKELAKDIENNDDKLMEEYLKELHLLRMMFMETAKGSLYTNKITATYVVEEDEEGNIISKQLYTNRKGQKLITVETQSHLPDTKSLVALNLVEDLILKATATMTNSVVDEDEIQQRYLEYVNEAKKQKEAYLKGEVVE